MSILSVWHPVAVRRSWPGVAVAAVIALAATYISTSYGGPQLLYALFFGLAFHFLSEEPTCKPGIEFCSKTVLRTGVALLGAKITLAQIVSLGIAPIVTVICALVTTMLFGWGLSKWLGRPAAEGVLSGGAVAICGASAAMAIAAVLPHNKENEKFTLLTVVGITALSTTAMIVYPLLVKLIGLDATQAGVFLGGTIHDVAQVVGAGYLISNHTGEVATFVKLTRVACLVPAVLTLSIIFKGRGGHADIGGQPLVPVFLIVFVLLVIINSFGVIPPQVDAAINTASRACLVTAIAALGVKTSFQALAELGWRPVVMLVAETVWIGLFVLLSLLFVH